MPNLRRGWDADTTASLLSSEYRRRVLRSLDEDSPTTRERLVTDIVDEFGRPDRRKQIEIRLHHAALPRLADAGVVRYDPETRHVELTKDGEKLVPYLDAFEKLP